MTAVLSPPRATKENRPPPSTRHPTAPSVMTVNGHFANVGEKPTKEHFEHGIQVINEDQEFKYADTLPPEIGVGAHGVTDMYILQPHPTQLPIV